MNVKLTKENMNFIKSLFGVSITTTVNDAAGVALQAHQIVEAFNKAVEEDKLKEEVKP